jgi:hypothetical protein
MYMKIERTRISTLQPANLVAWVDTQAKKQQRTRTDIIRMALEAYRTATLPHMPTIDRTMKPPFIEPDDTMYGSLTDVNREGHR